MKNQLKKSLSLMLAVLMVLSCWVWVAPTKAEAEDYTDGWYYVKYVANVTKYSEMVNTSSSSLTFTYAKNNGTGERDTVSKTLDASKFKDNKDNVTIWEGYIPGFPVSSSLKMTLDWKAGGSTLRLEKPKIYVGTTSTNCTEYVNEVVDGNTYDFQWEIGAFGGNDKNGTTNTISALETKYPYPNKVYFGGVEYITIPDVTDKKTVISRGPYSGYATDQYGVYWWEDPEYFLSQRETGSPDQDLSDKNSGFWLENTPAGVKINVNSTMQEVLSVKTGNQQTYYLVAYSSGNDRSKSAAVPLNFTYPMYDWYFNATVDGSGKDVTITLEEKLANGNKITYISDLDNDGAPDTIIDADDYLAYNQRAPIYPLYAERPGFEFLGFWTKPQPSRASGSLSNPYTEEDKFVSPVSTEEYGVLSAEEKDLYADAGEKWNPAGTASISTGDKEYYAWWLAKDITVKFYDIDGKFLAMYDLKAGDTNTAIQEKYGEAWPQPKKDNQTSYDSGSVKYSTWTGKWKSTKGEIVDPDSYTFVDDLMLIPEYTSAVLAQTYGVTVYDLDSEWLKYTNTYNYRAEASMPNESEISSMLNELADIEDNGYTYTFEGWSKEAPSTGKTYHIMQEDGDYDADGNPVTRVQDFVVRSETTYYPVFRRHAKTYAVTFSYTNEQGRNERTTVDYKYGDLIEIPEEVPEVYAARGKEYKIIGWVKVLISGDEPVTIGEEVCSGATTYMAEYDEGTETPYKITFEYRDEKGELKSILVNVTQGDRVLAEDMEYIAALPAEIYDDGEKELHFKGNWEYNGTTYTKDSILALRPGNHMTFTAVYEDGVPFRTVTYVDGSITQSYRITEGSFITPWTYNVDGEPVVYTPSKPADEHGVYVFEGWFDEEQTSEDFSETNGTEYYPGTDEIGGADLVLYPQFTYDKYDYYYKFVDSDGKQLYKATLHYGDNLAATSAAAKVAGEAAAAAKEDNAYTYMFLGWDKRVPDFCEGGEPGTEIIFVAQYKELYKYYDIEWYGGAEFDDEGNFVGYVNYDENGAAIDEDPVKPFTTSKNVYGSKIFTPYETLYAPAATAEMIENGQRYAFAGWCYIDENGEVQSYSRDITVDGNMQFFATYEPTDIMRTVTVIVDDKTSYEITVKNGETLEGLVSEPVAGFFDDETHNEFAYWSTTEGDESTKFFVEAEGENAATAVVGDITIYANFTVGEHEYTMKEVTKTPSYPVAEIKEDNKVVVPGSTGEGEYVEWCECSREDTESETKYLPALIDTVDPAGTAYVGAKWNGENGENEEAVRVSPKTDLIITTTDKGNADQYYGIVEKTFNEAGTGIGVQTITLTIKDTDGNAVEAANGAEIYNWTEIQKQLVGYYETWEKVPTVYKHYNANATRKAGDFGLENGKTYVATYVITDINGNDAEVVTAPFTYDDVAPVITLNGATLDNEKYCAQVDITVTDDSICTVTAGEHILRPNFGKYVIAEAGYYNIVVEDEAGNKSSKYVQVVAGSIEDGFHTFKPFRVDPTCDEAGYETRKCEICGFEDVQTPIAKLEHDWNVTEIKATCTTDGEKTRRCDLCGITEVLAHGYEEGDANYGDPYTSDKFDEAYKATDHNYGEGVITKAAACNRDGVKTFTCANCGHKKTEIIPADGTTHNFYAPKILKPNCILDGEKTQTCRYCGVTEVMAHGYEEGDEKFGGLYTEDNFDPEYKATGHKASTDYKVILEPGCEAGVRNADDTAWEIEPAYGKKVKYCTVCDTIMPETEEQIAPHNNHSIYLDEEASIKPEAGKEGTNVYKCEYCSYVKEIKVDALEKYTVTFVNENGTVIETIEKYKGETVTIDDPAKENSVDGKYKYIFDGWYTGTAGQVTTGNIPTVEYDATKYDLPLEVTGDITLYAKFSPKEILYTLKFVSATDYTVVNGKPVFTYEDQDDAKELQGIIGDERKPNATPKLDGDSVYTFEFAGWNTKPNASGEDKDNLTKIELDKTGTADRVYYAQYKETAVTYSVVFMESVNSAIYKAEKIPYGGSVTFDKTKGTPEKAFDDDKHYTFNDKWYTDSACTTEASLKNIKSDMVVYAGFTGVAHDFETKVTQAQECLKPEITKSECKYCDFEKTEQTKPQAGHTEGTPVYDEKTGENVYYCTVETCKVEIRREKASYTIKFVNYDGLPKKTLTIVANGEVKYDYEEYGIPERKADQQYSYTFAGWEASDGTKYAKDAALPKATADETYKAYYSTTTRTYNVSFATKENVIIKTFTVEYGEDVSYAYTEAEFGKPKATADGHYKFISWDKDTTNVSADLLVRPTFELEAHSYDGGVAAGATCTTPGGTKYSCACGYSYMGTETVPATGHDFKLIETVEPDFTTQTDGKKVYECQNPGCGEKYTEVISAKLAEIKVTVKDTNGNPVQGAVVQLYSKADGTQKGGDKTGSSGVVTFWVQPGEYTVTVKVSGMEDQSYDVSVDEDGNTTGNLDQVTVQKPVEDNDCDCSCHRDNFWGAFFRFFQKIIKLFTGKASCCADPDSRI